MYRTEVLEREPQNYSHEVGPTIPQVSIVEQQGYFAVDSDSVPGLLEVRLAAYDEAQKILEHNRFLRNQGRFDEVPLDVDALGTARRVNVTKQKYGRNSAEYQSALEGFGLDYVRKVSEVFTKNTWDYYEPTMQQYDREAGMLYAHGWEVDTMLINGLTPLAVSEEGERRVNDVVLHETKKSILQSPDADEVALVHIMPCPDWAIQDLEDNPKGAHGGYAPEVEKLMVGYEWFDYDQQLTFHDQTAVPGIFYTEEVMNTALQLLHSIEEGQHLDKQQIHAHHVLTSKDAITGSLQFVALLDHVASEQHGVPIFMGEQVPEEFVRDYAKIPQEAAKRRESQKELAEEVKVYVQGLFVAGIDAAPATYMVEKFIKKLALDQAQTDPELAAIIFDQSTADGFREAARLAVLGNIDEANRILEQTRIEAPDPGSCGAGSCGLEGVDLTSGEGKRLSKLLNAKKGDEIVRDKERVCKECKQKTVVYAHNKSKVNKACDNEACKAFESKRTN